MVHDVFSLLVDRREFFGGLLIEHMAISGTAVLIASVLGLAAGMVISGHERLARYVMGATNVVYTIPSISMLGFLIPVTGIGNLTAIIALAVYGLLPVIHATYSGLKNVDPDVLEAARGMGGSPRQTLFGIRLPLALPAILSGMRTMVVMTIALTGIASFIGAGGLGVAIYRGITTNNAAMTVAGSLLIALFALLADCLFARAEKCFPWRNET